MSSESFLMRRAACGSFVRLAVEIHEDWIEAHRYLNMEMLREQRKQLQSWRSPKVNATACSQTGCSGLAPAPELFLRGSGCRNLALIAGNGVIQQSDAGPRPKLSERQIVNNSTEQMSLP